MMRRTFNYRPSQWIRLSSVVVLACVASACSGLPPLPNLLAMNSDAPKVAVAAPQWSMVALRPFVGTSTTYAQLLAQQINERGYRTRNGEPWTRTALFYLLPRLIEVGPRLCTSEEWVERRKHLFNVA